MKFFRAILHTQHITDEKIKADSPYLTNKEAELLGRMYALMDGQYAIVSPEVTEENEYALLLILDRAINKEVEWILQQDPEGGSYINQREAFERDWENDEYESNGFLPLKANCVEICTELAISPSN